MSSSASLARARRMASAGTLHPAVRSALLAHDPGVFDPSKRRLVPGDWFDSAARHVAMYLDRGRQLPSSMDTDREVAASGKWWDNRRSDEKRGRLGADRAAYLDEHCPGWRAPRLMTFIADADTHIALLATSDGRFPLKSDADPEIAASARWWENRRNEATAGRLDPERAAYLDEHCPGWRDPKFARFRADADGHVSTYLRLGRKFPSAMDPDPDLRSCGHWWTTVRRRYNDGTLPPERVAYLNRICLGWQNPRLARFLANADTHITIHDRLGKYPTTAETDPELRKSGLWWADRRREARAGTLDPERAAYLDDCCPGWRNGNRR